MNLAKIIFLTFVVLLGLLGLPRFFVMPELCSRSLECASLYRAVTGPFHANYNGQKQAVCGDLASMANRMDLCVWRSEVFQTDSWGYRNAPNNDLSEILIFGDSFAFGQGNTQGEIPSQQLQKITGKKVYNGAGKFELNYLRWLLDNKPGLKTVVYLHLERHHHRLDEFKDWNRQISSSDIFKKIQIFGDTLKQYNPLKILVGRADKKWITPGLFPNRFEEQVPIEKLKNGETFLFLKSSVSQYGQERADILQDETAFFKKLQETLKQRGINLVVGLIPEKYTVYAPLLEKAPLEKPSHYLNRLEQNLRSDVATINLLPIFEKTAAEGTVIYWPDDSHWNAQGIALAMNQVAKTLSAGF